MKNFLMNEDGQGMVEYGLIIALVSIAAVAILGTLGVSLKNKLTSANTALNTTPEG